MSCPTIVNEYRACAGELTECDHLRFWEGRLRFCMLSASRTLARTACQSHSLEKKIQKTSHYGGTERRYAYKSDPSRAYSSSLPLFWSHIDTLVLSIKAPGEPKFYTILPYVIASWFIVPCLTLKSSWPGGRCIHTLPSSTGPCP